MTDPGGQPGRPVLPAPDQDGNQLRRRVLVRRHDVDGVPRRHGREPDGRRRTSACSRSGRRRPASARRCRSTTSGSTARTRRTSASASRAATATSSTAPRSTPTKFNAIVRDDPTAYSVRAASCTRRPRTATSTRRRTAPTSGPFFLQSADHAGADWVIETKVDAIELSGGYEQAGLLARVDDDNYVKFDILVRRPADDPEPDRAAQRGRRGDPEPAAAADAAAGQRRERLAAPDQDGDELQGRVLVRRHDVHGVRRDGAERDGRAAASACSRSA